MKTAPTALRLAKELDKLGLTEMAAKARENYYNDVFSPLDARAMRLGHDLFKAAEKEKDADRQLAIMDLRKRHINYGEFDATLEESKLWIESPEGQATMAKLHEGK